ncbi:MAG: MFS transporter, partial [Methanospirillum sp.]|uniref:MFS transporter n=1 Tax=Methanospirillum sp. TaxID=45200 RepID=UPI002370BC16
GTLLCGFANSLETLLLFRIITGLGIGGEWAAGQTFVCEIFPPCSRGRFGAIMQTGAPFGILLASFVGGFLSPIIGWRLCFILSALPALLVLFIRKNLPESDLWKEKSMGNPEYGNLKPRNTSYGFKLLLSRKYRYMFLYSLVLAILGMSAYWFCYSWLPEYLYLDRSLSLSKSTTWMIIAQIGGIIGYFSFGYITDHIGRRITFSIYTGIMALGLVMITLLWNLFEANPIIILGSLVLVGFGTGFFGGYGPIFSELFPTAIRNMASGTAFNLARGIQLVTPILVVYIGQFADLGTGIVIGALFAIAAGIWIWVFPETKGRDLKELDL